MTALWGVAVQAAACTAFVPLLAGCGSGAASAVEQTAGNFAAAVAQEDGLAACRLLAPSTRSELQQSSPKPCAAALLAELNTPLGRNLTSRVYGDESLVEFEHDTAFLAVFDDGWRVVAVGCTPPPSDDRTYDCRVKAG